jgi:hypothetical protein
VGALRLRFLHKAAASPSSFTALTVPTISGDAIVGQILRATNGTYSLTPDSITPYWALAGAVDSAFTGDTYLIDDSAIGSIVGYAEIAHRSGSTDTSLNAAVSTGAVADINLSGAAPVLTRTSAAGVSPFTVSMAAFSSAVYDGYAVQRVLATNNTVETDTGEFLFANRVYDETVYLDAATLAAPNTISWPAYDDSGDTQLYEQRRIIAVTPGGFDRLSPWSNIVKKSDALTNSIAYTKYRLSVTTTPSGFYTLLGEFQIAATPAGADTVNNSGVTISASDAGGAPAANARDGNLATYWATNFSGVAYPHVLTVDYTAGTPIAANEFRLKCATGGGEAGFPKDFTIDGWNGSAWVNLLTETTVTATSGETKTYVL